MNKWIRSTAVVIFFGSLIFIWYPAEEEKRVEKKEENNIVFTAEGVRQFNLGKDDYKLIDANRAVYFVDEVYVMSDVFIENQTRIEGKMASNMFAKADRVRYDENQGFAMLQGPIEIQKLGDRVYVMTTTNGYYDITKQLFISTSTVRATDDQGSVLTAGALTINLSLDEVEFSDLVTVYIQRKKG